jgi:hypothetical protein
MDNTAIPEVTFSTVQGILSGSCTQSGCHGDNDREFSLIGYDQIMSGGKVKAGNAHKSSLYTVLKASNNRMPPNPRPALSNDDIKRIYIWIEQGARNN